MKIEIKKLNKDAVIPEYATSGSAAVDLRANITKSIVFVQFKHTIEIVEVMNIY